MHLLSYGPGDIHRDGLEQAGEPSAHSAGKRRSAGMQTGECAERGNAGERGPAQEGAGKHRKLRKSPFHRPGREQAYQRVQNHMLPRMTSPATMQAINVEFMGPQQPNGEMAQWGNMPQRGNGPKGKVRVHTRK